MTAALLGIPLLFLLTPISGQVSTGPCHFKGWQHKALLWHPTWHMPCHSPCSWVYRHMCRLCTGCRLCMQSTVHLWLKSHIIAHMHPCFAGSLSNLHFLYTQKLQTNKILPNCPGFGQAGSLLVHGSNRANPCFSSSELWWNLDLLAASVPSSWSPTWAELADILCKMPQAEGSNPSKRGLVREGTSGWSRRRELKTWDPQLCLWLAVRSS